MAATDVFRETAAGMLQLLSAAEGQDYIGEPISQLQHALQAAHFARQAHADAPTVLAALLHDVGHLLPGAPSMEGLGALDHERRGAEWLARQGCSATLCALVAGHVQAKRYLCARHPEYEARLSPASRATLALQGGPMLPEECTAFEADPLHRQHLQLRAWDERAKDPNLSVNGLEHYRPLLEAHLQEVAQEKGLSPAP